MQRVVARNLLRAQQSAGFEMGRQMHRAESSLQPRNGGGFGTQRLGIDRA
jgi:hypothetical protein